jgi:hypothetical protein
MKAAAEQHKLQLPINKINLSGLKSAAADFLLRICVYFEPIFMDANWPG